MPLYDFYCPTCDSGMERTFKYGERPDKIPCESCQVGEAEYRVAAPKVVRIQFEQNGRVGYRTNLGGGKSIVQSATRKNWEHNVGNKSQKAYKESGEANNKSIYTKELQRIVDDKKKEKDTAAKKLFE